MRCCQDPLQGFLLETRSVLSHGCTGSDTLVNSAECSSIGALNRATPISPPPKQRRAGINHPWMFVIILYTVTRVPHAKSQDRDVLTGWMDDWTIRPDVNEGLSYLLSKPAWPVQKPPFGAANCNKGRGKHRVGLLHGDDRQRRLHGNAKSEDDTEQLLAHANRKSRTFQ